MCSHLGTSCLLILSHCDENHGLIVVSSEKAKCFEAPYNLWQKDIQTIEVFNNLCEIFLTVNAYMRLKPLVVWNKSANKLSIMLCFHGSIPACSKLQIKHLHLMKLSFSTGLSQMRYLYNPAFHKCLL